VNKIFFYLGRIIIKDHVQGAKVVTVSEPFSVTLRYRDICS